MDSFIVVYGFQVRLKGVYVLQSLFESFQTHLRYSQVVKQSAVCSFIPLLTVRYPVYTVADLCTNQAWRDVTYRLIFSDQLFNYKMTVPNQKCSPYKMVSAVMSMLWPGPWPTQAPCQIRRVHL